MTKELQNLFAILTLQKPITKDYSQATWQALTVIGSMVQHGFIMAAKEKKKPRCTLINSSF